MLDSLPHSVASYVRIHVGKLNEANRKVIAVAACRGIESSAAASEVAPFSMTDTLDKLGEFVEMARANGIDGRACIAEAAAAHADCTKGLTARWSAR